MFLVTFDRKKKKLLLILKIATSRSGATQMVYINWRKSCEIISQMLFNVMFSFSNTKVELVMT